MREEKRRRLEARAWKVGTARKFLRLSAEEAAYIELLRSVWVYANGGAAEISPSQISPNGSSRADHGSLRWRPAIRQCPWICSSGRS